MIFIVYILNVFSFSAEDQTQVLCTQHKNSIIDLYPWFQICFIFEWIKNMNLRKDDSISSKFGKFARKSNIDHFNFRDFSFIPLCFYFILELKEAHSIGKR